MRISDKTAPDVAAATGIPLTELPKVASYLRERSMPVTYEALVMVWSKGRQSPGASSVPATVPPTSTSPAAPPSMPQAGGSDQGWLRSALGDSLTIDPTPTRREPVRLAPETTGGRFPALKVDLGKSREQK